MKIFARYRIGTKLAIMSVLSALILMVMTVVMIHAALQTDDELARSKRAVSIVVKVKDAMLDVRMGRVAAWAYAATNDPAQLKIRDDYFARALNNVRVRDVDRVRRRRSNTKRRPRENTLGSLRDN